MRPVCCPLRICIYKTGVAKVIERSSSLLTIPLSSNISPHQSSNSPTCNFRQLSGPQSWRRWRRPLSPSGLPPTLPNSPSVRATPRPSRSTNVLVVLNSTLRVSFTDLESTPTRPLNHTSMTSRSTTRQLEVLRLARPLVDMLST